MGYRLFVWLRKSNDELSSLMLLALTLGVTVLVFLGEAIGIAIGFGVSPMVVLGMAFDFDLDNLDMIRPGWFVLAAGLCVVVLNVVRSRWRKPRRAQAKPVPPAKAAQEAA
jgi:hypothetical protein